VEKMNSEFIKIGEALLVILELTESVEDLKEEYHLSDIEYIEFDKITSKKRQREYLGVRLALKLLLGRSVLIEYNENGKPFLADKSYQISISHSKNFMAVIAHQIRQVGIDIECPSDKIQKIYKRFLSVNEQNSFFDGIDIRKLQIIWSAKETLFKIIGNQAVDFSNQLELFPFEVSNSGKIQAKHIPTDLRYELNYIYSSDFTLAYCLV
jgi:phosphopantetheinyl transferase